MTPRRRGAELAASDRGLRPGRRLPATDEPSLPGDEAEPWLDAALREDPERFCPVIERVAPRPPSARRRSGDLG